MEMESYILSIVIQKRVSPNITNLSARWDTRLLHTAKERRAPVNNFTGISMEFYLEKYFGLLENMKDPQC